MRLLFVITDLQRGGTPTVVRELACRLRDTGMTTEVVSLSPWGPISDELRDRGIPVHALDATSPRNFFRAAGKLAALLETHRFDLLFSFLVHANVLSAWVWRRLAGHRPRLVQSIQTTQRYPRWHWLAQRWAARCAHDIIVPSQSIADAAAHRSGIARDRIHIIPNAIDASSFVPLRRDPSRPAKTIGFLGRLDRVKRIDDLIQAMPHVNPNLHLMIFGEGPERNALIRTIAHLGLESRVSLRGMVRSPQEALRELDLLILPSEAEGMPMVLIEAMAAGIPIIGTNVAGIRDVIHPEQTGLLVPARDSRQLAEAINRLSQDAALRCRLVAAAIGQVEREYGWSAVLPIYRRRLIPTP